MDLCVSLIQHPGQSQLWGQTRLRKTVPSMLLKTSQDEVCITYLGNFLCAFNSTYFGWSQLLNVHYEVNYSNLTEKQEVNFFTVILFPLNFVGIFWSCYYHYDLYVEI